MAALVLSLARAISKVVCRILIGFWTKCIDLLPLVRRLGLWIKRNFGKSLPCYLYVYLGVLSTNSLPITVLALFIDIPNSISITISPIAALAIAALVVDKRAYERWKGARRAEMGIRMIQAFVDGLLWIRWCVPLPRRMQKDTPD